MMLVEHAAFIVFTATGAAPSGWAGDTGRVGAPPPRNRAQ